MGTFLTVETRQSPRTRNTRCREVDTRFTQYKARSRTSLKNVEHMFAKQGHLRWTLEMPFNDAQLSTQNCRSEIVEQTVGFRKSTTRSRGHDTQLTNGVSVRCVVWCPGYAHSSLDCRKTAAIRFVYGLAPLFNTDRIGSIISSLISF